MNKKGEWFALVLCLFLISISYVSATPPSPPNVTLVPPSYCTITNGGVEICDNIDNDCDGLKDENLNTTSGCNQVGYCYGSYKTCTAGVWSVCSKLPGSETCNAIDDDCNGVLNNGLPDININTSCSVAGAYGVCLAGLRYQFCNASVTAYTWTSCTSIILASPERCNALDDDCDNSIDENLTNTTDCNQIGYCTGSYKTCSLGVWSALCSKVPGTEVCNNIDDDCDGTKDENLTNTTGCIQYGYCAGSYKTCSLGVWSALCSKVPIAETCNNIDDNCNNIIDDNVTRPTTCGVGICANNTGVQICSAGVWTTDTCNPYAGATAEICEGTKDENCNGVVDENCTCTVGSIKTCGDSDVGECAFGNQTCVDGLWGSVCVGVVNPVIEVCDGLDNDCDNSTDENLTDVNNCSQLGRCLGAYKSCSAGNWSVCSILPINETCNNVDDDCDGVVDNDLTDLSDCNQVGYCAGAHKTCSAGNWSSVCSILPINETCNNVDDDCDGVVDDGDVCYVPPVPVNTGAGGGGGGGGSYKPTTVITNTTNVTNVSSKPAVVSSNTSEKPKEVFVNTSLVEIIPLDDKIENLSMSESNKKLFTVFNFSPLKMFIVGSILMCMVVFLSIFILDYSRKKRRAKNIILSTANSSKSKIVPAETKKEDSKKLESVVLHDSLSKNQNKTEVIDAKTSSAGLSSQELQAVKYINTMRQKGFKDDYIAEQLRSKGWKEETLIKLFKK